MGAYHSGIEINGQEWTYSESGVFYHKVKAPPTPEKESFVFKESIAMGRHDGNRNAFSSIIAHLREEDPEEVDLKPFDWINRPASIGGFFTGGNRRESKNNNTNNNNKNNDKNNSN